MTPSMHTEVGSKLSLSEKQGLTYDQALMRAGGFGNFKHFEQVNIGIFQYFATLTLMFVYVGNGYLFYSLTYLELFPDYICPKEIPKCDRWDKCRHPEIPIDWESTRSLHNWVEVFNLECKCVMCQVFRC